MADDDSSSDDEPIIAEEEYEPNNPVATFTVSGGVNGRFRVEILLDRVPRTASNFIDLATRGFYDGMHIHRVMDEFMFIFGCEYSRDPHSSQCGQGGSPNVPFLNYKTGAREKRFTEGGTPGCIEDEFVSRDSNLEGTLTAANFSQGGKENTGGPQLFINVVDNPAFDWFDERAPSRHPVFGRVFEGWDVCLAISKVQTGKPPERKDAVLGEEVGMTGAEANPVVPIKVESVTMSGVPTRGQEDGQEDEL